VTDIKLLKSKIYARTSVSLIQPRLFSVPGVFIPDAYRSKRSTGAAATGARKWSRFMAPTSGVCHAPNGMVASMSKVYHAGAVAKSGKMSHWCHNEMQWTALKHKKA